MRQRAAALGVLVFLLVGARPLVRAQPEAGSEPDERSSTSRTQETSPPSASAPTRSSDERAIPQRLAEGPRATPQRAVSTFLTLARAGSYAEAAEGLDAPPSDASTTLARQLHAVLERRLDLDVDGLSTNPEGDLEDGLPHSIEELGRLPLANAKDPEPIRLVRRMGPDGVTWLFSKRTLTATPTWYESIDDRYLREHLPESLLRSGPFEILYWQWLALALLVPLAFVLGSIFGRGVRWVVTRLAKRTKTTIDDQLVPRLAGPIRIFLALAIFDFGLHYLLLSTDAAEAIGRVRKLLVLVTVATALVRTAHVLGESAIRASYATGNSNARSFVPIAVRTAELLVFAGSAIWVFAILGFDVRGVLAGLGVGGVVVALAAKSTVENLLGAFSIGFDQPLREGDTVSIDGKVGTVERVGLRSTRIRTPDRTVLTYPNGKLADMTIESLTARDRFRLFTTVALGFGTTAAQVRAIRDGIDALLEAHPNLGPDARSVRLVGIGPSSLQIDVAAWFVTPDFAAFAAVRETLLLAILEIVEKHGASVALPAHTVHLVGVDSATKKTT